MKNFSAGTTNPNTPETDKQAKVWNTVEAWDDDMTQKYQTQVFARDPLEAINIAQYRAPELWEKIP